ncbi:hypothetical protein [Roseixanthobacter glucoisosaccharinicivorans]|uniref:hypothetical protein n=1 Tax=Roseixanthobacter glucoisosaccharinicivorans TaxID=3119923 RepID=UPI003727F0B3
MRFLILDHTTADAVRGPTAPGAALAPVLLADGATWVLPEVCATAPEHVMHHALLAIMPVREVAGAEWQPSVE